MKVFLPIYQKYNEVYRTALGVAAVYFVCNAIYTLYVMYSGSELYIVIDLFKRIPSVKTAVDNTSLLASNRRALQVASIYTFNFFSFFCALFALMVFVARKLSLIASIDGLERFNKLTRQDILFATLMAIAVWCIYFAALALFFYFVWYEGNYVVGRATIYGNQVHGRDVDFFWLMWKLASLLVLLGGPLIGGAAITAAIKAFSKVEG